MTQKGDPMEFSKEELTEARRQIESTLHKLRQTVTLAARRIRAFEIAEALIAREME